MAGIASNVCVESTLRDAYFHEYWSVMIEDQPCPAGSPEIQRATSPITYLRSFGWVSTPLRLRAYCTLVKQRRKRSGHLMPVTRRPGFTASPLRFAEQPNGAELQLPAADRARLPNKSIASHLGISEGEVTSAWRACTRRWASPVRATNPKLA